MILCKYEDGKEVPLRHVTVDAVIVQSGRILLIKRSEKYFIEPGKFALPGGFLDRDETCEQAVKREVLEETGYQAVSASLFRLIDQPHLKGDDRQNVGFFYIVTVDKKVRKPDYEVTSIHWFPVDNLPQPNMIGFDHLDTIKLYLEYLNTPFPLPLFN